MTAISCGQRDVTPSAMQTGCRPLLGQISPAASAQATSSTALHGAMASPIGRQHGRDSAPLWARSRRRSDLGLLRALLLLLRGNLVSEFDLALMGLRY